MPDFYKSELSGFGPNKNIPIWSAILAWLLIPLGLVIFVDEISKNYISSFIYGGLYGLILYGLYGFTNYSILSDWTLKLLIVDIIWGIFLCSVSSGLLRFLTKN